MASTGYGEMTLRLQMTEAVLSPLRVGWCELELPVSITRSCSVGEAGMGMDLGYLVGRSDCLEPGSANFRKEPGSKY